MYSLWTDKKLVRRIRNKRFLQQLCLQESHILLLVLHSMCCPPNIWPGMVGLVRQIAVPKKLQQNPPNTSKSLHWPLSGALGLNSSSFSSSSLLELSVFPFICSNWSKLTRPTSSKLRLTFERNTSVSTQHEHEPARKSEHKCKTKLSTPQSLLSLKWQAVPIIKLILIYFQWQWFFHCCLFCISHFCFLEINEIR